MPKLGKIGIVGLGKMGACIVRGLLEANLTKADSIGFTTKHPETIPEGLGSIRRASDNLALAKASDIVILSVKPQNIVEVMEEIGPALSRSQLLISIAAGVTTDDIGKKSKAVPIIRAMPNTPALIGQGMTAICLGRGAEAPHAEIAKELFGALGRVTHVDENLFDAVTGLSGCGPAYAYVILEALSDAGIKVGLPRKLSIELAAQTLLGAAQMLLETGRHPAELKDEVTTPAGCTIDGLMELEEGKLRVTLIKAVVQATKRSSGLAKSSSI